jgi:hypothetical protein
MAPVRVRSRSDGAAHIMRPAAQGCKPVRPAEEFKQTRWGHFSPAFVLPAACAVRRSDALRPRCS